MKKTSEHMQHLNSMHRSHSVAELEHSRSTVPRKKEARAMLLFLLNQAHAFSPMPDAGLNQYRFATGNHPPWKSPATLPVVGLGKRRLTSVSALRMLSDGNTEYEQSLLSRRMDGKRVKELLELPVPVLINKLDLLEDGLSLHPSDCAKILDKVCEYSAIAMDPETSSVSEDIELQKQLSSTYGILKKRGILNGFGSCASALVPMPKENFDTVRLKEQTGLPFTAFSPGKSSGLDLLAGSATAFAAILGDQALGLPSGSIAFSLLAALIADNLILRGSIGETIARKVKPAYREIVLKHEAGHLLVAYLLGNPIQACLLDSWSALKDGRFYGVQAGTVFYDPELGENMKSGRLSRTCLDRYSIVVMAGIAAEAMSKGQAEGGSADENAIIQLLSSLDGGKSWDVKRIQSQARWGVTQAFLLLRDHESAYKALCEALSEGASIGEAIMAIEGALSREDELPAAARIRALEWRPDKVPQPIQDKASTNSISQPSTLSATTPEVDLAKNKERKAEIDARLKEINAKLTPKDDEVRTKDKEAEIDAKMADNDAKLESKDDEVRTKDGKAEIDARLAEASQRSARLAEIQNSEEVKKDRQAEIDERLAEIAARLASDELDESPIETRVAETDSGSQGKL